MQLKNLPFFYHPSTIVMVDDQATFLRSMVTAVDRGADCRGFIRPEAALKFLNEIPDEHPLFSQEHTDSRDEFLVSPKVLANFLASSARFKWFTTVIVDYTMPTLNGLEFCRQLKSPFIRKIMLTGDASLDVAIKAFNDGLIDKFFKKSDENILEQINEAVVAAQFEYFANRSERWQDSLPNKEDLPLWLHQPEIVNFIVSQMQATHSVEFYVLNEAGDILLIDAKGEMHLLLMRDEKGMAETFMQADFAYKSEPEPESLPLLEKLKKGELILEPLTQEQMYESLLEWKPFLHPAKRLDINGKSYYHALIPANPKHLEAYLGVSLKVKPFKEFEGEFKVE